MKVTGISRPYEARAIRFIDLWQATDWTVKVYGIARSGERPPPDLVRVGKELALRELPRPAVAESRYGVGILIAEEAREGNYVMISWWVGQDRLKTHLFSSPPNATAPEEFRYVTPSGLGAGVWNLHVLHFERTAWVTSVLARSGGPDLQEYLVQRFSGDV